MSDITFSKLFWEILQENLDLKIHRYVLIVPQKDPAWIVILKNIGQYVENRRIFHSLTYSLKHLVKCFGLKFLMCFISRKSD